MADGLLNKASIILTPTGYKAGTLYNVAPVVEPYEDFDFARASVASRVNSSGLVEMVGRTLSSELVTNGDFATDSDWTKLNATISGGKGNLDGNGQTSLLWQDILTNGKSYKATFTVSDYNGSGSAKIINNSGGTIYTITSDGTFTTYFTHSIANGNFFIRALSGAVFSIDNVSVKEIIDTNNIPRISYDSNGDNGHILLEPTSTNLLSYSQEFDHSSGYWNKANTTIETTTIVSPDGSSNTYKLFATTSTSSHFTDYDSYTGASSGQTYTFSFFVKSAGSDFVQIASSSGFPSRYQNFNLLTGTKASGDISNATIESYPNGWYRISVTETTNGTSRRFLIVPVLTDAARNPSFAGNAQEDGVYIFGAQLEELSYPTSYIPTNGSTETRATETATGAGSATLINSTEGVLYAEIAALADDGTNRCIALSDGSVDDRISLIFSAASDIIRVLIKSDGSTSFDEEYEVTSTLDYHKVAMKYKANDFALWIDGVERFTDTSGSAPIGLNQLTFNVGNGILPFYGKCKAVAVFNEALSDDELNNLTG